MHLEYALFPKRTTNNDYEISTGGKKKKKEMKRKENTQILGDFRPPGHSDGILKGLKLVSASYLPST